MTQPRPAAQPYGYAWLRAPDPDSDQLRQHAALKTAGCLRVWMDRESHDRSDAARNEREQILAYLRTGDTLVVCRLDCLARTTLDLAEITAGLRKRRIGLRSLDEGLDSTIAGGQQLW